ncbi:hypothetical protein Tco_1438679 [Tanacetum coccineum]
MFDGTLATDEAKWDSFSNQVKSQFGGNVDGLALQGIDLAFLRNLPEIPNMNLMRFHVNLMTKGNHHDCGIFTMLHMECYNAGAVANWDCGLYAEIGYCLICEEMPFLNFATKYVTSEINVHAQKFNLAKEFDKLKSLMKRCR